jgi:hypothetical protein
LFKHRASLRQVEALEQQVAKINARAAVSPVADFLPQQHAAAAELERPEALGEVDASPPAPSERPSNIRIENMPHPMAPTPSRSVRSLPHRDDPPRARRT